MRRWRAAGLLAALALAPLPFSHAGIVIDNLVLAAAYATMALGLNVIVGFAGLLDLGYVAFYAIGAYSAAYLRSGYWPGGIHLNLFLVLAIAAAVAVLAGTIIGVPTLRLRKDYVAMVTLAFGEIIGRVALNGRDIHLFGGTLTYGPIGIGPIDVLDVPVAGRLSDLDLRSWYWFALVMASVAFFVNRRLRDSRIGRAWLAVREDEDAAAGVGVPLVRAKLTAYATGAAFGAMSGVFLASYYASVNPSQFDLSFSIFVLAMVVCGGAGSIGGAVVGAVLLSVLTNYVLPNVLVDLPGRLGLDADLSLVTSGLYGVILVVAVLLRSNVWVAGE